MPNQQPTVLVTGSLLVRRSRRYFARYLARVLINSTQKDGQAEFAFVAYTDQIGYPRPLTILPACRYTYL